MNATLDVIRRRSRVLTFFGALLLFVAAVTVCAVSAQDAVVIRDWDKANADFVEWQKQMFEQRRKISPELKKVLYKKVVVPLPAGEAASTADKGTSVTFEFMSPFALINPFAALMPSLKVTAEIGAPQVTVSGGVKAKVLGFVSLSHRAGATYSSKDGSIVFKDALEAQIGVQRGEAPAVGIEAGGGFSLFGQESSESKGGKLGISSGIVGGAVGVDGDGQLTLTGSLGPQAKLGKFVEVESTVEVEMAAPVKVKRVEMVTNYGLARLAADWARKTSRLFARGTACTYCAARGSLTCPQCQDVRTVTCPDCGGTKQVACGRCDGGGTLSCSPTEWCSACSGSGRLSCGTCGGSGSVYGEEEYTDWVKTLVEVGFDENGQPYERWETQPVQKTRVTSVTCGSCGGSGKYESCGACGGSGNVTCTTCSGEGWVYCGSCNGSGMVNCGECSGSGVVTCPTCGGRPILCPLCGGATTLGGE
ncbi:MAG: hypothetical protein RDV41_15485 [Planctomycetota bacterium]|nr:hypothetical protein [Planctomycetota bacterium]